jgi:hypothetical protein
MDHERASKDEFRVTGSLRIKVLRNGAVVRELGPFKNKVVSSDGYGRNLIARAMAGDGTYPIAIDSASIGTGNTAPADGDTDLETASVSAIPITNAGVSNNVLTIDVFVPDADLPDGTYEEFGLFAALRLVSHVLISPSYTKAAGEDTLFTYTLTFTG